MNYDWHLTQNDDYLELLKVRISSDDKLIWVQQFADIINNKILDYSSIKINDFGCNVGHFCKIIPTIKASTEYTGYDISETYLKIARENFKSLNFVNLDISKSLPETSDVSIMSATLEHIPDHEQSIKNIFLTTKKLFILRTFIGEEYLEEKFLKDGASDFYLIKQFTVDYFVNIVTKLKDWDLEILKDKATNSETKIINNALHRTQKVLIFSKR